MIRFLLCFLILFSWAQAQDLSSYLNMYEDSRTELELEEDEDEIVYQRLQTVSFPEIERRLTDEEERALVETGVTEVLSIRASGTTARDSVLRRYEFEKSIYQLEKRMIEELEQRAAPSNENESDGSFDLVKDLNLLDEILFGSQAGTSEPEFAEEESELSTDPEAWQVGDPRAINAPNPGAITAGGGSDSFPTGEGSISAAIEDLMTDNDKLNAKPLNLEYPTKKFFDTGQVINSMKKRIGLIAREQITPGVFLPTPELVQLSGDSVRQLIDPIMTRFTATDNRDFFSRLDTQQAAFASQDTQDRLAEVLHESQVNGVQRGGQTYQQAQDANLQDRMLEHLGLHLESMKDQFLEIEETLERFHSKPRR